MVIRLREGMEVVQKQGDATMQEEDVGKIS
jgi:hypothetical protein